MLKLSEKLKNKNLTIAVAESCTSGLLASTLTDIQGSSNYFMGGIIVYNNLLKKTFLNIPKNTIIYSKNCTNLMNIGLQKQIKANIYISVSGYLEPINLEDSGVVFYSIFYKNHNYSFRLQCYENLNREKQKEFVVNDIIDKLNSIL